MKRVNSARVIRSKNFSPTHLTIDILFNENAAFKSAYDKKPDEYPCC